MEKEKISFVPKARLIQILGEYLIKDATVGLLELIKNSYDADATLVSLEMYALNSPQAKIVVRDNGSGMDVDTFLTRWMNPATGHKEKQKYAQKRTRLGRLPLGEKGVGRFATQQIGDDLTMISKTLESENTLTANVDWTLFEDYEKNLSQVEIEYDFGISDAFSPRESGTVLEITGLKTKKWTEGDIKRISNNLKRMKSPFKGANNFDISLEFFDCPPEFEKYADLELTDILEKAHYKLFGVVDEKGLMQFEYDFNVPGYDKVRREGEMDLRSDGLDLGEDLICGGFIINLHHYVKRNPERWLQKSGISPEDVNDLSGVSVYRDGMRILPYGEKGDDWLNLDNRRIQKTNKIGNDTIIGLVELSQDVNVLLKDKTNREGLIENPAYYQFRKLVLSIIKVLEEEKEQDKPKKQSKPEVGEKFEDAKKAIDDIIRKFSKSSDPEIRKLTQNLSEVGSQVEGIKSDVADAANDAEIVNKRLFNLAGTGLAAERFTHEFSRLVAGANGSLGRLRVLFDQVSTRLVGSEKLPKINKEINTIGGALEALRNDIRLLAPMFYIKRVASEKELNLKQILENTLLLQENAIKKNLIEVEISGEPFSVVMREGSCMQVFNNLVDNAIFWVSRKSENDDKKIKIIIDHATESVFVSDSGPGVVSRYRDKIFEPFFSMKGEEGRGLGLYIISEILEEKNWGIFLVNQDDFPGLLKGASFRVVFNDSLTNK